MNRGEAGRFPKHLYGKDLELTKLFTSSQHQANEQLMETAQDKKTRRPTVDMATLKYKYDEKEIDRNTDRNK